MTINIALVTGDGLVMGCDSIASMRVPSIDPFEHDWMKGDDGEIIKDEDGRVLLRLDVGKIKHTITELTSGVTKMFPIHNKPTVIATTAGLARMNDLTMHSLAGEFISKMADRKRSLVNVDAIAKAFLRFMRSQYDVHYKDSTTPEEFRDAPEFLVGGYGRHDHFASLYRVNVQENAVHEHFAPGSFGLAWAGQSDSVERLIRGYDSGLKGLVEEEIAKLFDRHHDQMTASMLKLLAEVLQKVGAKLPKNIKTTIPAKAKSTIPWDSHKLAIRYGNMPLQKAIDFVSWLVMIQSGRAKFAVGLPTVGGRTHIGVINKEDFKQLGEPDLEHRFTGFEHDL